MNGFRQNERTRKQMEKNEAMFLERKDEIRRDLEGSDLSLSDLEKKYGLWGRSIHRWGERLGVDMLERAERVRRHRSRKHFKEKTPVKPPKQKWEPVDAPQAHKVWELWG